jgi:nucleotide-binding universal stress UspA family protein
MSFKTILVPVEQHDLMTSTLETALVLARKFDSYIEGFALRPAMSAVYAVGDVSAVAIPSLEHDIVENAQRSQGLFENFMRERGVAHGAPAKTLSSSWLANAPAGDLFVGSHGRLFELIVLGKPGRGASGPRMTTLEAALFETGRPVLIAPPSAPREMGTNILIAWNRSTEQARTVAFAMPLLRRANRVVVLTVEGGAAVPGPTGEQLCQNLQLSGVPAKPLTVGLDGRLTGEAVLAHAKALGCDLLIKGAYTQSRLRQFVFGGTTSHILSNSIVPVFMAH